MFNIIKLNFGFEKKTNTIYLTEFNYFINLSYGIVFCSHTYQIRNYIILQGPNGGFRIRAFSRIRQRAYESRVNCLAKN